eukprot:4580580-Alexandrium_andersonii.AAC.1
MANLASQLPKRVERLRSSVHGSSNCHVGVIGIDEAVGDHDRRSDTGDAAAAFRLFVTKGTAAAFCLWHIPFEVRLRAQVL